MSSPHIDLIAGTNILKRSIAKVAAASGACRMIGINSAAEILGGIALELAHANQIITNAHAEIIEQAKQVSKPLEGINV